MSKAEEALLAIPCPTARDEWLKISMAYKATPAPQYEVWDRWCQTGNGYDQAQNKNVWDSINTEGGITAGTLYQIAKENNWNPTEEETVRILNCYSKDVERYLQLCESRQDQIYDYFETRGITRETIKRFHIGYDPKFVMANTDEPRAIIPYPGTTYYTARRLSKPQDNDGKKYLYPLKKYAGGKRLFNTPALQKQRVFVVEGQIDAISICQCGFAAVGCNEKKQLLETIKSTKIETTVFYIIPDRDITGEKKAKETKESLEQEGYEAYIIDLPTNYHDINDMLIKNQEGLKRLLENANQKKRTIFQNANSAIPDLKDFIFSCTRRKTWETGFPKLDEILNGGLHPGLYCIGGLASVGKTTFLLQMLDSIAEKDTPVMILSLEMSRNELITKSISRIDGMVSTGQIFYDRTMSVAAFDNAAKKYAQIGKNTFIIEGNGENTPTKIREMIENFLNEHKSERKAVIAIDYMQIITPEDPHSTDKQNTDRAANMMKRISRDFEIPVVVISSFNRENYAKDVNMSSFKESGTIEYTSDVLIGLQIEGTGTENFDIDKEKRKNPRMIELKILKNRNGRTGETIKFLYHAAISRFTEK